MRVLVVDDEVLVRKSLARVLRSRGHDVVECENGQQGLAELLRPGRFDLVLLDVIMPGLTGPEILEKWSASRDLSTRVVLMSAFAGGESAMDRIQELKVDRFVAKPFDDIFLLADQLEELNGERKPTGPS